MVTTWNVAAEQLFGYNAKEIIGRPWSVLAPEGLTSEVEEVRTRLNGLGPAERLETTLRRKDVGNHWVNRPGSVVVRTGRCGKAACSCRDYPPRLHGPFRSWTRKLAGKTVTRLLSEEQLDDYQVLVDNHRRLKELVHELEDLSVAIIDADHRWKT